MLAITPVVDDLTTSVDVPVVPVLASCTCLAPNASPDPAMVACQTPLNKLAGIEVDADPAGIDILVLS